jgi:hypothetical protein
MVAWLASRYWHRAPNLRAPVVDDRGATRDARRFASLSDLFEASSPRTESNMALVGGYWFQKLNGQPDFNARQVNDALKNLGHRLTNVTRALDFLRNSKPALVLQTHKSGKTKQARKLYRLTEAGIRAVEELIGGRLA